MIKFVRGEVPQTKAFLLADYVELLILVGCRDVISRADLETEITLGDPDSDPDEVMGVGDQIEQNGRMQRAISNCFGQLEYRALSLGEAYPFQLEEGVLTRKKTINGAGYIYLFLLICSRLASFSGKGFGQDAASVFVAVSADTLRAVLGEHHEVHTFDANSADRRSLFGTNLKDALYALAKHMQADPVAHVIDEQGTSGDAGVDLVAVRRFSDSAKGLLCYVAQCAAQKDGWPKKTYEARKLLAFIHAAHEPFNLVFIPVLFRKASGVWFNTAAAHACVLIDRLRIVKAVYPSYTTLQMATFDALREIVNRAAGSGRT